MGDYLPEAYALAANYLSALWAGLMEFADLITAKMAVLRCRQDAGGTQRARRPRSQIRQDAGVPKIDGGHGPPYDY